MPVKVWVSCLSPLRSFLVYLDVIAVLVMISFLLTLPLPTLNGVARNTEPISETHLIPRRKSLLVFLPLGWSLGCERNSIPPLQTAAKVWQSVDGW